MAGTSHKEHLTNLIFPVLLVLGVYLGVSILFILCFGWGRFHDDFWPPDRSFVGPNIVASFALVIGVVVHNEYVVAERAKALHEDHVRIICDLRDELLHPTEEAEQNIADQVEQKFRDDVLDRLDAKTPGGIGDLPDVLKNR